MKGLTFDIQRFALNDGPGIRTTVFLKGCYLKCEWCHNPESQSFKPQLSFNPEKCLNCFECVKVCPNNTHKIIDNKHYVDWYLCDLAGKCVEVCPSGALKIIGANTEVDLIISEVLKDKKYYDKTGGGITISGGEPMAQFEFTKELLIEAKRNGLHTVLDTCGYGEQGHYKEIIDYVDLFLFDYKFTDERLHKDYTGVSNREILANLDSLYNSGASIILRCPLIPGINDNENHLNGIKNIIRKYPQLKSVEIMPYHYMGRDKANRVGMEYKLSHIKNAEDSDKQRWINYFSDAEINVVLN
ncbi:MAG: glycyl-radical enzyme activating protein [Ignavibacteriaceae bacterium]